MSPETLIDLIREAIQADSWEECSICLHDLEPKIIELQIENKRLREAIHNVPTDEYGRVGREGYDDICGGWDWFLEKLEEWKEQTLKIK